MLLRALGSNNQVNFNFKLMLHAVISSHDSVHCTTPHYTTLPYYTILYYSILGTDVLQSKTFYLFIYFLPILIIGVKKIQL